MEEKQKEEQVIEEKIGEIEIKKIFDIFYSNTNSLTKKDNKFIIDYETFGKSMGFSKQLCDDLYAIQDFAVINVFYKEKEIPSFLKEIEIEDLSKKKEKYHIYRYEYCHDLITEQKKFTNPVIIINNRIESFDKLKNLFFDIRSKFKIMDLKIINYKNIFGKNESNKEDKITGNSYSKNFKYYFKYPKQDDLFLYHYSLERTNLFKLLQNEKIKGICGNFGIGKSTTLLATKKSNPESVYLNLKALMNKKDDILIWKYEIFFNEIAYSFKETSNYEKFSSLEQKLKNVIQIWECIFQFVDFVLDENIQTKLILDQYKEKYDPNYHYINTIVTNINNEKNSEKNTFKLLICSSINNKDVRSAVLEDWFNKGTSERKRLFDYIYIDQLFDSKKLIDNDTSLTQEKKDLIANDFNNIPRFYYDIKYIENNKLTKYKSEQEAKIQEKITEFYELNSLKLEDLFSLFQYRQKIGKQLDREESYNFLKLVPFKYFIFQIDTINFYFPLVENIFDNFLSDNMVEILKYPLIGMKESSIGDILEFKLVIDLKNNKFDKFDEIFKVDSIWDLTTVEKANTTDIQNKNILILQTNPKGRLVDFGILNKEENLILIQCKKALAKVPDNYITQQKIFENRNRIKKMFSSKLNANIKKINLMYVTGIQTQFNENDKKQELKTWGNKDSEDFKNLEKMCEKGECLLIYYDPIKKLNFIKSTENKFKIIESFIKIFEIIKGVIVENNEEMEKEEKFKIIINKYFSDNVNNLSESFKKIRQKKNESENFLDTNDRSKIIKKNLHLDKVILGVIDFPEPEDFMINNLYIGFKRKRTKKKYLCFRKKNNDQVIYEINDTNVEELNVKLYDLISEEKIDKCFYIEPKNN